jgi:hypothetical protein
MSGIRQASFDRFMAYQTPRATVLHMERSSGRSRVTIRIDRDLGRSLAPATLYRESAPTVGLLNLHRLIRLDEAGALFDTPDPIPADLAVGDVVLYQGWWDPDQFVIAQTTPETWQLVAFEPLDAELIRHDGSTEIIPGGWDHEHCRLCWAKIGKSDDQLRRAYFDGSDWLCTGCYETYVVSGLGRQFGNEA